MGLEQARIGLMGFGTWTNMVADLGDAAVLVPPVGTSEPRGVGRMLFYEGVLFIPDGNCEEGIVQFVQCDREEVLVEKVYGFPSLN